MTWLTRGQLAARVAARTAAGAAANASAQGGALLVGAVPGEGFVPLSPAARARLRARSIATLDAVGGWSGRRVVVSLGSDGDLAGALCAEALAELGASAAVVGPRGRMRTLAAMRALRPQVWLTTPTGGLDFLARLYLEFNVDPLELELEEILVVGEIASRGTERRLAAEFEARVTSLYCDPIFGALWACGRDGRWSTEASRTGESGPGRVGPSGGLGWAALATDQQCAEPGADAGALAEIVIAPDWPGEFEGCVLRTGQVRSMAEPGAFFAHTVGDHVLARGRWLSLPALARALATIDGLAGHRVTVSRGDGTLDRLEIALAFARAGLVDNPMWAARAREAIASVVPIEFALSTEPATSETLAQSLVDPRGHHLGPSRAAFADREAR